MSAVDQLDQLTEALERATAGAIAPLLETRAGLIAEMLRQAGRGCSGRAHGRGAAARVGSGRSPAAAVDGGTRHAP